MQFKSFIRFIHSTPSIYSAEKSSLAILRKKTGYTFANCKKALELHQNDLPKAEQWLKEQAQALGWSKATKLEGRITQQGLVGVIVQRNIGAMVEVNCETDFVARNKMFQQFVESVSVACLHHFRNIPVNNTLTKLNLEAENLKSIEGLEGKSLGDELALLIGNVGENATLRRAICFKSSDPIVLFGVSHPTNFSASTNVHLGKYGSIVAAKCTGDLDDNSTLPKNICQHIIGMKPDKVGSLDVDKPNEDKDEERCLIHQEFILEPGKTAGEIFAENSLEVVDFCRFECGENIATGDEKLNVVEAVN
ncbi:Elongation factor Ts, mitochondrial [Pseudolycoriella hygida]|uniref:Elongation factor Ts, mitochondrial n=1 Tax=Pseudolycoriella hygida TaxID=35572 RepID=A0A9Q0NCC3_9DIPT|nr:Elongation factor Ts, mitochondrial [Pseudolycoriella hygida]